MNSRTLIIDGRMADLPDSVSFNLVWQVADPGELKIYGSGSSTIKLPFTPANDDIFGNCKHLTVVGGREFQTFSARYYERGVLMIDGGNAYLTAISDGYEICITWGNGDAVQRLRETNIYDVPGIGAFRWDASQNYPLAETSGNPKDYPTFYLNSKNLLTMRLAMNRPLVKYTDVLAVAGINGDTVPERVWDFVDNVYLQVNGTQAVGYYTDAVAVRTSNIDEGYGLDNVQMFVDGTDGAQPTDTLFGVIGERIGQIAIGNDGQYRIEIASAYLQETGYTIESNQRTEYFGSFCVFLVDGDYGETLSVCRDTMIQNMFADDSMNAYEATYRCTPKAGGVGHDVHEAVVPLALGYTDGKGKPLTLFSVSDFGKELVRLQKKTYYLYICPRHTRNRAFKRNDSPGGNPAYDEFQRTFNGDVFVDSTATFRETTVKDSATKIDGPDDPILQTDPPDIITMLGYSNLAEIAEDFLTLFPLMCQAETGEDGTPRLQYFGFDEVMANGGAAYDWSGAFVSLDKVEIGNQNVGLRNRVRFASYGDYAGFRADGTFDSFSLKETDKEYGTMKRIANYDYMRMMDTGTGGAGTVEAGEYPLVKVNEKDGVYSAGGLDSVPSVFFVFYPGNIIKASVEGGGSTSVFYSGNSDWNTFNYIINGEQRVLGMWRGFLQVIRRQKTVTVTLNIHPSELNGFDFTRPVYIRQLAVYLFVQKITYKGGMKAEFQGIVLPSVNNAGTGGGELFDSANNYLSDSNDKYLIQN